jgi:hypothetical protein
MRKWCLVASCVALVISPAMASEQVKLPPEVTPALRAACEQDVRRLCISENPTYDKVKQCVEQKFAQLNTRCRLALASAGFGR